MGPPMSQTSRDLHDDDGHVRDFLPWVAQLVHEHRAQLLAYARRRGLDAEDSLDAVQDAFASFLRLPQARAIAGTPSDAIKLLTVVLRHDLLNRRRKGTRRARVALQLAAEPADDPESSEQIIERAERLARVHGCILAMGPLQRSVVRLSLLDPQPREEVAAQLGVSEGYLRVLVHRAREHLRTCPFDAHDLAQREG
jgi:RNA polymerase sigma-70 factor (ECF subfamily)